MKGTTVTVGLMFPLKPLGWECISAVFIKTGKHPSGHDDPAVPFLLTSTDVLVPTGCRPSGGAGRRHPSGNEVAIIFELRPQTF